MATENNSQPENKKPFIIQGLGYVSLYFKEFEAAVKFYSQVFGPPMYEEDNGQTLGWRMGSTWLTFFPSKYGTKPDSNPCNTEFTIQVSSPGEVDALFQALVDAGAKIGQEPVDSRMYERMRYAYVDDPFGVRIDISYPLTSNEG